MNGLFPLLNDVCVNFLGKFLKLPKQLYFFSGKQKASLKALVFALMLKQKAKGMKFAFVQSKSKSKLFCFFALLFAFRFCFAHRWYDP